VAGNEVRNLAVNGAVMKNLLAVKDPTSGRGFWLGVEVNTSLGMATQSECSM